MNAWSKSNSLVFLIKNDIIVLKEIETKDVRLDLRMTHDLKATVPFRIHYVILSRQDIGCSIKNKS